MPNEYLYEEKTSEQGASCDKFQFNFGSFDVFKSVTLWVYEGKSQSESEAFKCKKVRTKEEY